MLSASNGNTEIADINDNLVLSLNTTIEHRTENRYDRQNIGKGVDFELIIKYRPQRLYD